MILPIRGAVQHYEWGGYRLIPELLGIDNSAHRPYSELWLGAHPNAPATAECAGAEVRLDDWVARDPVAALGPVVAARYAGRLPYLLKVLDARSMLSIQAHPNKRQAEAGFARENAQGVSLKAANRNYRDDNHKPEVHVALTEFWMLHGFRPLAQLSHALDSVPELSRLQPFESVSGLYEAVMKMPQAQVEALLDPLIARLNREVPEDRDDPDFWAHRAAAEYGADRGIFSVYLLNLVHLHPGEGTYQPAGVLHAYLEGANVELMANSDNVLRGGLTPKHVDVDELMRTLTFTCQEPDVLEGEAAAECETVYRTAAEEFELSRIVTSAAQSFSAESSGPEILLVLDGVAAITTGDGRYSLARGGSAFVPYGVRYSIAGPATVFRARVP